ncbi:hypothetical protein ACFQ07_12600, partial [Actinomadura adrarensis]
MGTAVEVFRGGAIYCPVHERWECRRDRQASRGGGRCHNPAVKGYDRCRMHIGMKMHVAEARTEAMDAWAAIGKLDLTPAEAVIGMYKLSWTRAHLYASLLEEQFHQAQDNEAGGGDGGRGAPPVGEGAGLIGHTFSADKEWGIFATGEAVRGLAKLEADERERCVKFARAAHDMGIAEREIRIAEQQGQ